MHDRIEKVPPPHSPEVVAQEKDKKSGQKIPVISRAEGMCHLAEVDLPERQVDESHTDDNADCCSNSLLCGLHLLIIPRSTAHSNIIAGKTDKRVLRKH